MPEEFAQQQVDRDPLRLRRWFEWCPQQPWIAGSNQVFYSIQINKTIGGVATTKKIGASFSGLLSTLTSTGWTASYALTGISPIQNYTITVQ